MPAALSSLWHSKQHTSTVACSSFLVPTHLACLSLDVLPKKDTDAERGGEGEGERMLALKALPPSFYFEHLPRFRTLISRMPRAELVSSLMIAFVAAMLPPSIPIM